MRHIIVRAAVLGFLAFGAGVAYAVSAGPPAARTGAPAFGGRPAESNCTLCHTHAPVNSGGGSVRILGVPANWAPNTVYPITVQLEHPRNPLPPDSLNWGFQLQAAWKNNGTAAGAWLLGANAPPDTFIIKQTGGSTNPHRFRRYIEHTRRTPDNEHLLAHYSSLRRGELGPVTWTLQWRSPIADSGMVYFFVAGNAANGDWLQSASSADFIYTSSDSSTYGEIVDVPPTGPSAYANGLDAPYPNPMSGCTSIDFTLARGGLVDIGVFDLQGRRVRTLVREYRPVGLHALDWDGRGTDGSFVRNGVYFVRMLAPGEKTPITQKVTMSR